MFGTRYDPAAPLRAFGAQNPSYALPLSLANALRLEKESSVDTNIYIITGLVKTSPSSASGPKWNDPLVIRSRNVAEGILSTSVAKRRQNSNFVAGATLQLPRISRAKDNPDRRE